MRQVAAAVDEDDVGRRGVEQGGDLGGRDADLVLEQAERGEDLGRGREVVGEQQQGAHPILPVPGGGLVRCRALRRADPPPALAG